MKAEVIEHALNVARRKERCARDARRARMGEKRYRALVLNLACVIRLAFQERAVGSLWGLEGPFRAAIRSDLCLQLWAWPHADAIAKEALDDAFRFLGAVRPTWYEGQPEWAIEAGTLIERTRCARCHKPLPEGHHKFCSRLCSSTHAAHLSRLRQADEDTAVQMVVNRE